MKHTVGMFMAMSYTSTERYTDYVPVKRGSAAKTKRRSKNKAASKQRKASK